MLVVLKESVSELLLVVDSFIGSPKIQLGYLFNYLRMSLVGPSRSLVYFHSNSLKTHCSREISGFALGAFGRVAVSKAST